MLGTELFSSRAYSLSLALLNVPSFPSFVMSALVSATWRLYCLSFNLGNEFLSHGGTFSIQHFHALLIGVSVGFSQGHLMLKFSVALGAITGAATFEQPLSALVLTFVLGGICQPGSNPHCPSCGDTATSLRIHHRTLCFFFQWGFTFPLLGLYEIYPTHISMNAPCTILPFLSFSITLELEANIFPVLT